MFGIFKRIILISLLSGSSSFSSTPIIDWEAQSHYDWNLSRVLDDVIAPTAWPDCRGLIDPSLETEYPGFRRDYAINGEIPGTITSEAYSYFLVAADNKGVRIKAENKFGGRTYIYDSEWNIVHYIFQTPTETRKIGKGLIEWLVDENFVDGYGQVPEDDNWRFFAVALGYRGCYTGKLCNTYKSNLDNARFDMLGCFGSFLVYDDLRAKIFEIVSGGRIFADEAGREKVVRGIISKYGSYPKDLQKKVLEKLAKYLETVDDEKTNYSKKIAEFVLEKGGTVPDRSYWEYDTAWHPFSGSEAFSSERKKTRKPAVQPPRGAEGSSDSE